MALKLHTLKWKVFLIQIFCFLLIKDTLFIRGAFMYMCVSLLYRINLENLIKTLSTQTLDAAAVQSTSCIFTFAV